ncbi:glycosyltransferase [Candidatus Latescibacterota bacterium]
MKKMTIGHIDTHLSWRGGQKQVIALIKGLNKLGQRNILFCKDSSEIAQKAVQNGMEVITIPFKGEWDLVSAYKLRSHIKKENLDILHTHTSHAHTHAIFALMGLDRCKLVVSRRVDFHIQNYFSRKYKYGKRVDKIIAVSNAIKRVLVEDGVDPDLVVVVMSGFVPGTFERNEKTEYLRKQLGIPDNAQVVSTVAALAPHKAHFVLLKAAKIIVNKHPEVKFILAGEGEMRPEIEKNIKSLELEDSVTMLGFVENVGAVYKASNIFAISSEEEGLCTSILDAMYFALPIVATKAGGIPELVHDGINGFIVPVNDHNSFAEKVNFLIESPEIEKKMGLRSTEILKQNTIDNTIQKTFDVYKELCC